MNIKNNQPLLVYIQKNRVGFFNGSNLVFFDYPEGSVVEMDVRKPSDISGLTKNYIETNKVKPGSVLIIVSDEICFEKDFPGENCDAQREQIAKFLDAVPFDYIRSRNYRVDKACKVVAVNRDIFEVIQTELEELGFIIAAVAPQVMTGVDLSTGLNEEKGKLLLSKIESLRQTASLFEMAKFITEKKKEENQTSQKRVPILLVFFGILILILIAVIIVTKPFENPTKKVAPVVLEPVPTPVVVVPTPVVDQASKSADLVKTLKAQVLNGSRISGQADLVKKQLLNLGINKIETGNSTSINRGNTTIVFSTTVPVSIREIIGEAVKKSFTGATSLEGSDLKFDVVVTTGLQGVVTITPTP